MENVSAREIRRKSIHLETLERVSLFGVWKSEIINLQMFEK